MKLAAIYCYCY